MRNITFPVTGTPALLVLSGGGTSGMAQPTGVPFFFVAPSALLQIFQIKLQAGRIATTSFQFPVSNFQFLVSNF
jgi:hypothetical protein